MIDSHCHLADAAFAEDLEAVVARAREAGVESALCILAADEPSEIAGAVRIVALWPEVRFTVGIHPHRAGAYTGRIDAAIETVRAAVEAGPGVRAIGEIGLDYHYDFAPRAAQREVFRRQLVLARELRLPVVVHTRGADTDTFAILDEERVAEVGGVLHCFTGDAEAARRGLEIGLHVSFAGIVTFPRAEALREVARLVPADRLLVETDAPYLAPAPHRGRRNEPAWVARVIETLAGVRGEAPAAVAEATTRAFTERFRP